MFTHTNRDAAIAFCEAVPTGDICLQFYSRMRTVRVVFQYAPEFIGDEFMSLQAYDLDFGAEFDDTKKDELTLAFNLRSDCGKCGSEDVYVNSLGFCRECWDNYPEIRGSSDAPLMLL